MPQIGKAEDKVLQMISTFQGNNPFVFFVTNQPCQYCEIQSEATDYADCAEKYHHQWIIFSLKLALRNSKSVEE